MPGSASLDRAHARATSGLQALVDLINEVRATWDTHGPADFLLRGAQPAWAGGPAAWIAHRGYDPAVDARSGLAARTAPTAPALRPSPRPRSASEPVTETPQSDDRSGPGDPAVEDEHAEVWSWVRRAQQGDGEAFGLLYDRYVDSVFRFIYYRVNDRALAEDFTSETFVRALRRIGSINYQGRDIGAWFVTIARNIVLDHVKSARNRLEVTTADTIESREHAASTESAVLETLTAEHLMAAVNQLGDEQRECVVLRFMQGLSVSETAAVMGKNDGAIKALQHRAVRKLAEIVGDDLR